MQEIASRTSPLEACGHFLGRKKVYSGGDRLFL